MKFFVTFTFCAETGRVFVGGGGGHIVIIAHQYIMHITKHNTVVLLCSVVYYV